MRTQSEINDAYNAGRVLNRSFTKNVTVSTVIGTAQDLSGVPGNPVAQYYLGAANTSTAMSYLLNNKGLDCGGTMEGYQKFIHEIRLQTTISTIAPSVLEIYDYLMFYPFNEMTAGVLSMTQADTLPRYSARDGVQMMVVEQNPYVGGGTFQIGYTNQDGVSGRLTPFVKINTATSAGTIASSAPTLSGATGDFIPLQDNDYGVQQVDSIEFSSDDVGTVAIVLVKPIVSLFLYENTTPSEYDLWFHLGVLPEIKNDAYLNFVLKSGQNITGSVANAINGRITTIWKQQN